MVGYRYRGAGPRGAGVIPALPYCKDSTGGVHDELIHPAILRARRAATEESNGLYGSAYLLSGVRTGCVDRLSVKTRIRRYGRRPAGPRRLACSTLLVASVLFCIVATAHASAVR